MNIKNTLYFYVIILIIVYLLHIVFPGNGIGEVPDVKWPFLNLKDENDNNVNMLVIRANLEYDSEHYHQFKKYYDQGIKFLGCSSYTSFPRKCDNPHGFCHIEERNKIYGKDIEDYVLGWSHCFREPDKYIKSGIPKILLSESDFNLEHLSPDKNIKIKYDYIMVQPHDKNCTKGWHYHNKNWPLAEKCIQVLSDELGLKGLIIGRDKCPINVKNKQNITTTGFLHYYKFIHAIQQSRIMVLPNLEDPSPRVLTEALAFNKPIMVYENILGGWKYVTENTGVFFNESTIREKALLLFNKLKKGQLSPREDYFSKYGMKNSGRQLRDFLKSINPDLSPCEYVRFVVS